MSLSPIHPADQLAMIMDRIYRFGMTTTSGGNLSILDENGDIWITPGGIDKGSLTRDDIVCIKPDGTITGKNKPSMELPFHREIYEKRPDVRAVVHAHPPALVAFSIAGKVPNTRLIPSAYTICGEVGMAEYGLPGSVELGKKIVKVFERGFKSVILQNHGAVAVGGSLFDAFKTFETLDFCARLEINAYRIGKPLTLNEKHIELTKNTQDVNLKAFKPTGYNTIENNARQDICRFVHRAYSQKLFTSTQGTVSQKLNDSSFLITPHNVDRKYIDANNIIHIDNGCMEEGKAPGSSVILHKYIYDKHPHINSVIIANPPNIMAFAVTGQPFDSRIIPESYIFLKNVRNMPFESIFVQPEMVSDVFKKETPIVLVESNCAIVTGSSLLNAFDRLEVLEYSAKSILDSQYIGEIVKIDDLSIEEIDRTFLL